MLIYRKEIVLEKTATQILSTAALNAVTAFGKKWKCLEINIHFGAAVTETVTITRDSKNGSNYDTVIKTESLTTATDFSWDCEKYCAAGDEIRVQCTAATATTTAYLTIKGKEI